MDEYQEDWFGIVVWKNVAETVCHTQVINILFDISKLRAECIRRPKNPVTVQEFCGKLMRVALLSLLPVMSYLNLTALDW